MVTGLKQLITSIVQALLPAKVEFLIDWYDLSIMTGAETTQPSGVNLPNNTRAVIALADITTPLGNTLDNYVVQRVQIETYFNSQWGVSEVIYSRPDIAGYGANCYRVQDSIIIQTGSARVNSQSNLSGSTHNFTGNGALNAPARVAIVAEAI